MRQNSAGSLDSMPGSETSSLSDHCRDFCRPEEESSIGRFNDRTPLLEKHDNVKEITSSVVVPCNDVITSTDVPLKDDVIAHRDNGEKTDVMKNEQLSKAGETRADKRTVDAVEKGNESQEGETIGDKGTAKGFGETLHDDDLTIDNKEDNYNNRTIEDKRETMEDEGGIQEVKKEFENSVADAKVVRHVDEPIQENLVSSPENLSDDITSHADITRSDDVTPHADMKPSDDVTPSNFIATGDGDKMSSNAVTTISNGMIDDDAKSSNDIRNTHDVIGNDDVTTGKSVSANDVNIADNDVIAKNDTGDDGATVDVDVRSEVELAGDFSEPTSFSPKTETHTDKYSSKFDDILDKLEESEDTYENEIIDNKAEVQISGGSKGAVIQDEKGKGVVENGDVFKENIKERYVVEESRKGADTIIRTQGKLADVNEEGKDSPAKQLTPSKFVVISGNHESLVILCKVQTNICREYLI